MPVLVLLDQQNGQLKKSAREAAGYAGAVASSMNTHADALVLGAVSDDLASFGQQGIAKVHTVDAAGNIMHDAEALCAVIAAATEAAGADVIIFSNNSTAKAVAPRLSVRLKAGLVMGAVALPDLSNGFVVKKSVFSGKAFAHIKVESAKKIICLNPNAVKIPAVAGTANVAALSVSVPAARVQLDKVEKLEGEISLSEADIVVSGGRGLKGPENWGMVTDLASLLGAATACSRPVADIHWRPHHEHVGQTGLAIAPNLYIAIGISGAIQHLAGVNRSKTIVVINKDPEAPFFKAADYGIVGDAFEVVPRVIEAVRKLKSS